MKIKITFGEFDERSWALPIKPFRKNRDIRKIVFFIDLP